MSMKSFFLIYLMTLLLLRNENCQCWEEEDPNPCKDVIDQKCEYDFGGICNSGPYLEFTEPTGHFCTT